MRLLLQTLGYMPTRMARVMFCAAGVAFVTGFLLAGEIFARTLRVDLTWVHFGIWNVWFLWHATLFQSARKRYLREKPATAYRRLFCIHIFPAACCVIAQMCRPLFHGLMEGSVSVEPLITAAALLFMIAGLSIQVVALQVIGVLGASFYYEFESEPPALKYNSIYGVIRHPLFAGGVIFSLGSAFLFASNPSAVLAGIMNVLVLPVYGRIEDERLRSVFGSSYRAYSAAVGGCVPKVPHFPGRGVRGSR